MRPKSNVHLTFRTTGYNGWFEKNTFNLVQHIIHICLWQYDAIHRIGFWRQKSGINTEKGYHKLKTSFYPNQGLLYSVTPCDAFGGKWNDPACTHHLTGRLTDNSTTWVTSMPRHYNESVDFNIKRNHYCNTFVQADVVHILVCGVALMLVSGEIG